jgi:CRISPR-associated protein Csb2
MFSICVEFLQGRVAAARPADDRKLEWPIEPARLYMALVAAHFESESEETNFKVLEWFERLPPPRISAPAIHARSICVNFVPVNDRAGDKNDPLGRSKQPRHFASGFVGDGIIRFMFDGSVPAELLPALEYLLANVVRIGHSSSLVRCWLESNPPYPAYADQLDPTDDSTDLWVTGPEARPIDSLKTSRMRVPVNGTLAMLERCMNQAAIDRYAELKTTGERSEKPKARTEAKELIKSEFPLGAPTSQPIKIGTHAVYHLLKKVRSRSAIKETVFDPAIIPLVIHDGNSLGLESTQLACKMLRNALLSRVGKESPAWVSGHGPAGEATREPHLAFVPLAFVGDAIGVARFNQDDESSPLRPVTPNTRKSFADGHLMGFGLVLPRNLLEDDKAHHLGDFLFDELGEPKEIILTLGDWGELTLIREDRVNPPRTLRANAHFG